MTCFHPMLLKPSKKIGKNGMVVPCSRCLGCRLDRSRDWATRIMNEVQLHKKSEFMTLTYRDDALTWGNTRPTLVPRDLELFWKRLRKEYGDGIRYFAAGEYGDKRNRPHYHACVFGIDIKDKKLYTVQNGNDLYSSDSLDSIWSHGNVRTGDVTFESAAYVARYVMKKRLGETANYYEDEGIEPEFARMSNKPGIGAGWLEKYFGDVFPRDKLVIRKDKIVRPPRYYMKLLEKQDPMLYALIKAERRARREEMTEDGYDLKRLAVKERIKIAQTKNLTRKYV